MPIVVNGTQISSLNYGGTNIQTVYCNGVLVFSAAPATPTNVTAYPISNSVVKITWSTAARATYYKVYRSSSSSEYTYIGSTTGTSCEDTVPHNKAAYYYKIEACNDVSSSPLSAASNEVLFTRPNGPTLSVAGCGKTITLSWSAVLGATSYKIYHKVYRTDAPTGNTEYSLIATTTDTNYASNKQTSSFNFFYVVAVTGVGDSDQSNVVSA